MGPFLDKDESERYAGESGDIHGQYVAFETRFLEYRIVKCRLESTREYYRRTFSLMSVADFDSYFRGLSPKARRAQVAKWRLGFEAWLRRLETAEGHRAHQLAEFGPREEAARRAVEMAKRYGLPTLSPAEGEEGVPPAKAGEA